MPCIAYHVVLPIKPWQPFCALPQPLRRPLIEQARKYVRPQRPWSVPLSPCRTQSRCLNKASGSSRLLNSKRSTNDLGTSETMPVSSRKALRVTGIPEETTEIAYHEFVECLCQQTANNHESSTATGDRGDNAPFIVSRMGSWTLARQHEHLVGTVSFPSHSDKMKALKRLGKRKASFWRDWNIEHVFRGVTVLYENEAKTEFVTSP
jgi:hypothetical protein